MKELLTQLANLYGTSGRETSVASFVKSKLRESADNLETDKFGNVIATKEGTSDFSIMLAAHIDEIGLAIEKIDEEGFAYPSRVGGWDPRILPGKPMRTEKGWGVISTSPRELLSEEDQEKAVQHNDLFIESHNLTTGEFLVQDAQVAELGKPNRIVGKSFDDRAGVAMMIKAFNEIESVKPTIHAVGTVQEEVGLRGAGVAAYKLNPDLGIVLETALADDVPVGEPHTPVLKLGEGPAITVKDATVISHPKLNDFLINTAEKRDIPYQLELLEHGGTDAGRIHITREGVPSTVIGVPTRYLHSPIEVLDLNDLEAGAKLLESVLRNLSESDYEEIST
ncbi:MAG: M20/M25/M40 family metallo-hydrolase [Hadesarchaea archaeon]|nr:M20/M25/M40 family metallo-hydrolase [Hadesarchaea archaeon]